MKKIKKKGILQKTIIVILMVLTLNFIVPTYSRADWGGALFDPVVDLLCSIGDAVINVLEKCMMGETNKNSRFLISGFMVSDDSFFNTDRTNYEGLKILLRDGESVPQGATKIGPINPDSQFTKGWFGLSDTYHVPVARFSPDSIFSGQVSGLDINFIKPNEYFNQGESSASILQPIIAKWYIALRNLTVVGLLIVLLYVGIRIIISSTASDKAKYKQMLMDWLIALCLVFFMHYIMSFVLTITQSVVEILGEQTTNVYVEVNRGSDGMKIFKTNLLGLARFKTQYNDFGDKVAFLIMYLALVIYTCIFTIFYLKRLLMIAFLTIIAPVVALTYPIDKMGDGKSQAFDKWLKEYIYNVLIQPFHLIIYAVFVGAAMDLASSNIIYMIVTLGFITQAEKILRNFFGFEKASGTLGGLVGAAALGSMAKKAIGGRGGSGGKGNSGKPKEEGEKPPRFERRHDVSEIEGPEGLEGNGNNTEQNGEGANDSDDSNIHDRAAAMLEEETRNMTVQDYREGGMHPQEYRETRQRELEEQLRREEQNQRQTQQQAQNQQQGEENKKKNRFLNWTRAHNINAGSAVGLGWKGIKGATKFATKTAFKAGAGTLAGAVALASGAGIGGTGAAFMAGSAVGGRLGDGAIKVGGYVGSGVGRVGKAIAADWNAKDGEHDTAFANALLGGTALGREIDLANGNTRFQDAGGAREIKENKDNQQYVRDYLTAKNNGVVPSAKEVKNTMNSLDPYIAEGLTEIKDMLKAQKAEAYVGSKQAAIIAKLGQEKGITAEVLNDEKKAKAQQANLMQDFINKGNSKPDAAKLAEHTMNVLKVQQGVAHDMKKPNKSNRQNNN